MRDKTRAQNSPQSDLNRAVHAQLCLPGHDLAGLATAQGWCQCTCSWCPPWEHKTEYCRDHCVSQMAEERRFYPPY